MKPMHPFEAWRAARESLDRAEEALAGAEPIDRLVTWRLMRQDAARRVRLSETGLPYEYRGHTITYVIGVVEEAVKIGVTKNIESRLRTLSVALPVEIRLLHVGEGDRERELHQRARPWHIRGEWFHRDCLVEVVKPIEARP
jgi:hypothetical protein